MRFVIYLLVFAVSAIYCKNHVKSLTESMGMEVIEIGAPIKELPPGLDEEPSAELDDEKTRTSAPSTTKRENKKTATVTTQVPATQQQVSSERRSNNLSPEEEERRIEKELSEIYKDTDYKAESTNLSTDAVSATAPVLRQRGRANFKFQPDVNDRADVERFRTSIDDISCDKRVTQRLQEMVSIVVLEPGQKSRNQQALGKFEPVAIDTKLYGKFYNGDSYIVLKTTGQNNSTLNYDAHFWLGSKTTQDKKGSAAIWTVTLDDMLGGRAVHHREVQGHESSLFLGYFKPAIRYMEGGNESGFTEVETNAGAEKRLLKLSGCDNMRIEEVAAESSSLTSDHCFILEVEHDIFVLMPDGAKATQRRKIISVANTLRDDYHNGRATIEIIDEFSSDDDFALFFEALGSGSKDDLASDDSTDSYARDDPQEVYLNRVLLGDDIDLVSISKPYKQRQLSTNEVYILDTPCSGVYIWLGADVDSDVKKTYHDIAQKYLDLKGYPAWVNITRIAESSESPTFKQYFHEWDSVSSGTSIKALVTETDAGYFSSDVDESTEAAKLIGKSAAARGLMPDNGDGDKTVTRIASGQEDITESLADIPVLYQSEVYVVDYKYTDADGNDATVIYCWIGADASQNDKREALELVSALETELKPNVVAVKIPQGKETLHFLSLFKGNLAMVYGSKDNEYKPENANGSYDDDGRRLFRVEGTSLGVDMRVVQLPERAEVLEDDDVFVLETTEVVYVRHGKESSEKEQEAAHTFAQYIAGDDKNIVVQNQGEEDDEFWEHLGGPTDEKADPSAWRLTVNRRVTTPKTLTAVTVKVTGKIVFEDLDEEYTQQDLSDDSIYILDTGEELYLWQGQNTPERALNARNDIVKEYIEDDGMERSPDTAVVVSVHQAGEPRVFRKLFPDWSGDMWQNQASYDDIKNDAKAANSK